MKLLTEVSPTDGAIHQQNLFLLNLLASASNQSVLVALLGSLLETGDNVLLLVSSGASTKAFVVMNPTLSQLTIVIGGMDNTLSQAPGVLQTWDGINSPGVPVCFNVAANFIFNQVTILAAGGYQKVRVIGHSYGGSTAMWLASSLAPILANVDTQFEMYTYGSPKESWIANTFLLPEWNIRRAFQNNDPVPSLPLSPADVGTLWAYLGVPSARRWGRWMHGNSGLTFDGNGGMIGANQAQIAGTPTLFYTSLIAWLTGINCFAADGHSLASYTNAVNFVRQAPRPTSQPMTVRIRRPPDPPVAEVARTRDEELATIAMNTATNPQDAARGIQSGIPQVPGVRYRGVKVNGVPWVYYGDTPVIPTRTVRTRRALVRYLNRSL